MQAQREVMSIEGVRRVKEAPADSVLLLDRLLSTRTGRTLPRRGVEEAKYTRFNYQLSESHRITNTQEGTINFTYF